VMPGTVVLALIRPLVTFCPAQMLCLGIQQLVQRLLHAATHDPVKVAPDPFLVGVNHVADRLHPFRRGTLGRSGLFWHTSLHLASFLALDGSENPSLKFAK